MVEIESTSIGWYWNHIYNHIFHSVFFILLTIWDNWGDITKMWISSKKAIFFSLIWLFLVNLISYLFLRVILRNKKKYKKELTKENTLINKESDKSILIDSMGLTFQYQNRQRTKTAQNQIFLLSSIRTKILNKTIPERLIEIYPFLLLILINDVFCKSLFAFWETFDNLKEIFQCLWDYGDYSSSLTRINDFLVLPEKNDNLVGIKPTKENKISAIYFQNITFNYESQSELVLKDYNRTFTNQEINYLVGKNGTGKSTILYLLLGMIKPQKGKIIIQDEKEKIYNLHQGINLKYWREQIVSYCAHDNLIEQGSSGQKQWDNIQQLLKDRKDAQIFCFDEADNALDQDRQKEFQEQLLRLVKKKKIVIYIKH